MNMNATIGISNTIPVTVTAAASHPQLRAFKFSQ